MLNIAGLVPLSTVDWPGKLAATVFLQGCPWRCGYCQNMELLDPRAEGAVQWEQVTDLLARRKGLLDAVVFTGGEATLHHDLGAAICQVRNLGFEVGLHTAGAYPAHFARLISDVDWVGLDIKALPDDYQSVVGYCAGDRAWRALDVLMSEAESRALSYEVRTTVHPGSSVVDRFDELLGRLVERGVRNFALQEAREIGTSEDFRRRARDWDLVAWRDQWARLVDRATGAGFASVAIRPA